MTRATALLLAAVLAGCGSQTDEGEAVPQPTPAPTKDAAETADAEKPADKESPAADGLGTPNEDRVATLGLLNKRNNLTQDLVLKTGETRRVGNVMVKLESCERTAPWETVPEEGAFVQVFVNERPAPKEEIRWRTVFSGWLFKNSPSLNVVEHPVYDVWVKDCAMSFPGEEAKPEPSASDSNASKPSGSDGGDSPSA